MWQRKTENDLAIEKYRNKLNIKTPTIVAFIASCVSLIWKINLEIFLFTFIIGFLLSYIGQYFFGDPLFLVGWIFSGNSASKPAMGICNKCNRVTAERINVAACSCGGRIEPMENWKWVGDTAMESETGSSPDEKTKES